MATFLSPSRCCLHPVSYSPGARRWQSTDYADFRVNYATHMHDPSIELREQEREESTGSAPAVPVGSKADTPSDSGTTATAEGVLVVAASPAPAPLASRSVNPTVAPPRRAGGGGWHAGGGSHKVGGCGGGGVAVPSQDRPSKSYCHERVSAVWAWCLKFVV